MLPNPVECRTDHELAWRAIVHDRRDLWLNQECGLVKLDQGRHMTTVCLRYLIAVLTVSISSSEVHDVGSLKVGKQL